MSEATGSAAAGTPGGEGAPGTGTGDGPADWLAGLPDEDRGFVATKGYRSPADLVRAYRGAERLIGRPVDSLLVVPGEDATPEDWDRVYGRLGRPQNADGYRFESEGDERTDAWLREHAHRAGLNQRQAVALRAGIYENAEAQRAAIQQAARDALEQTTAELTREWGGAFDEKEALAQRALDFFAGDQAAADALKGRLVRAGLMDAAMVRGLVRLGEALAEDGLIGKGEGFGKSPAEARAEIDGLQLDAEFMKAYGDRTHPGFKAANARMQRLFAAAYPER